uniref:SHR-BD domain-containing protein n=1 Tax=Macrostomum lignano TaxID=282301 RepID=A0A1I8IBG5_9PLAT
LRSHEHFKPSGARSFHLEPGDCLPVPIRYIADCAFRVRPAVSERWSVDFARESVDWRRAVKPMERRDALCACRYRGADDDILDSNAGPTGPDYHLVTSVLRENFPADIVGQSVALPGHSVFIEPPVCLVNLLPQDLSYHLPMLSVKGRVASGQEDHLHLLDSKRDLLLQLHLENFRCPEPLRIPWQARRQTLCLTMHDWNDKQLDLMVKLESRAQGPIRITVSACYWLINRTGLPLIIKQTYDDGGPLAGQGDEHEAARCVAPLLFSLSAVGGEVGGAGASGNGGVAVGGGESGAASDSGPDGAAGGGGGGGSGRYCSLRLGRHWQPAGGAAAAAAAKGGYSRWTPLWCEHFHPDSPGCIVRQLHMKPADQSLPNLVYSIGLEMRPGRGRYRHTNIITCTSRYQLHNRSSHVLAYAQRHCTGSVEHTITGPPTSYQAFHWTRDDKDKLLCVRLADQRHQPDAACAWSGGFRIDEVASFHVLLRSAAAGGAHLATRAPHFLRVEVTVHRSTFHVIFSDIDNLPLPYRIDNRSRVPVTYRQTQAGAELRSVVRPGASAPYALDEPALKPHITLSIPGGSCATYDMNCEGYLVCRAGLYAFAASAEPGAALLAGPFGAASVHPTVSCFAARRTLDGSGLLTVQVAADGPTRVLLVTDAGDEESEVDRSRRDKPDQVTATDEDDDWLVLRSHRRPSLSSGARRFRNLRLDLALPLGVGLSVVSSQPEEELLYITLARLRLMLQRVRGSEAMELELERLQADNQLLDTGYPLLLFHEAPKRQQQQQQQQQPPPLPQPVLTLSWIRDLCPRWNAEVFQYCHARIGRLSLCLEERLVWKVALFFGLHQLEQQLDSELEELDFTEQQRTVAEVAEACARSRRYYFGSLQVEAGRISLSVYRPSSELPPELRQVKEALNARHLIGFEDARVELAVFRREHLFETANMLLREALLHYSHELRSHAVMILGSVDFLGNPIGLFTDLSEGITGLIRDGNVKGLVTGSISDGLTILNMDERHLAKRGKLREDASKSGTLRGHWSAGVKGFGHGIIGGITSIITQPYYGASERGLEGFVFGVGKGLIGTVTKPVAGVLDFASEMSSSIRDKTGGAGERHGVEPRRRPRCPAGLDRMLKQYNSEDAYWQTVLYKLNNCNLAERYLTSMPIRASNSAAVWIIISDKGVYLLKYKERPSQDSVLMQARYSDIIYCRPHELADGAGGGSGGGGGAADCMEFNIANRQTRARVRCDSAEAALRAVAAVNHGLELYRENRTELR